MSDAITLRQAAAQATIALEHARDWLDDGPPQPAAYWDCVNAIAALRAALEQPQPAQPEPLSCGHPASLMLHSAETGKPLYCELCDDKSGRRDAEQREQELLQEVAELRAKLAAALAAPAPAQPDQIDLPSLQWAGGIVYGDFASLDAVRKMVAAAAAQPDPQTELRDAARYRWLCAEQDRVDPICHLTWKRARGRSEWVNTGNLDAAIDAAMGTSGEQG